jgi:hypothetical protein
MGQTRADCPRFALLSLSLVYALKYTGFGCLGAVQLIAQHSRRILQWHETLGSSVDEAPAAFHKETWYECSKVTAISGDNCIVGSWVVDQSGEVRLCDHTD